MTSSLVSITCFNGEQYVGEAIESALAQTYSRVEVIVIDDGSTDNSLGVIKSFGDRVRWETGPNRGGCAARNRGIKIARGELLQFLDADDLLAPKKVATQAPRVSANLTPFCNAKVVDPHDGALLKEHWSKCDGSFRKICLNGIQTALPLHLRSSLNGLLFDETLPCAQEYDFHIRIAISGVKFHYSPETLVTVRRVPRSVSHDYVKVMLQWERIILSAIAMLDDSQPDVVEKRQVLASVLARGASHLMDRGEEQVARRYWRIALNIDRSAGAVVFSRLRAITYRVFGLPLGFRLLQILRGGTKCAASPE